MDEDKENRDTLKYAAATFYGAGADTVRQSRVSFSSNLTTGFQSVSSMGSFFLAMMLYPTVLTRAQEELKRVVGDDRLPGFADRANLPYINAIVKETLRWEGVLPTGSAPKNCLYYSVLTCIRPQLCLILLRQKTNIWATASRRGQLSSQMSGSLIPTRSRYYPHLLHLFTSRQAHKSRRQ